MQRRARVLLYVLGLLLMAGVGCQRLNVERTINVGPGEVQDLIIDAPKSQQKVSVGVSSGVPVDVYVVADAEHKEVKDSLLNGKRPDVTKVLASKEKVQDETLEATVPAKTEFRILLAGATKPAEVKLKVTGR